MEPAKTTFQREGFIPNPKLRLREVIRFHHYFVRTELFY